MSKESEKLLTIFFVILYGGLFLLFYYFAFPNLKNYFHLLMIPDLLVLYKEFFLIFFKVIKFLIFDYYINALFFSIPFLWFLSKKFISNFYITPFQYILQYYSK